MAKFVEGKFDSFLACCSMNGPDGNPVSSFEIRVPHYLARMMVKQRVDANQNGHAFNNVAWIKFVREWFSADHGQSLGLKDAKDIVDHYMTIASRHYSERPLHLQVL